MQIFNRKQFSTSVSSVILSLLKFGCTEYILRGLGEMVLEIRHFSRRGR